VLGDGICPLDRPPHLEADRFDRSLRCPVFDPQQAARQRPERVQPAPVEHIQSLDVVQRDGAAPAKQQPVRRQVQVVLAVFRPVAVYVLKQARGPPWAEIGARGAGVARREAGFGFQRLGDVFRRIGHEGRHAPPVRAFEVQREDTLASRDTPGPDGECRQADPAKRDQRDGRVVAVAAVSVEDERTIGDAQGAESSAGVGRARAGTEADRAHRPKANDPASAHPLRPDAPQKGILGAPGPQRPADSPDSSTGQQE